MLTSGEFERESVLQKIAFWSLWAFVFTIPWEKVVLTDSFGSVARIVGGLAFAIGTLAVLERGRLRPLVLPHVFLMLFVGWATASYLWSFDPESTSSQILTLFQLLLMSLLIWNLCSEEPAQTKMLQAYVLGTFVSAFTTFVQYRSAQEVYYQRYAAEGFDPNDLALVLAISLPISYFLSIQSKGRMVWLYRLQILAAAGAIFLTASRGAMLASSIGLLIVPLTFRSLPLRQKIGLSVLILAVGMGAIALVPSTSWERLQTTTQELRQGDLNNRLTFWGAAIQSFRLHPVQGVGAGAFGEVATTLVGRGDKPIVTHNTFLSVLVETGLVGFLLFGGFFLTLLRAVKELDADYRRFWLVLFATWAVGVSALTWENRKPTWLIFALLLTQCASAAKLKWQHAHLRAEREFTVAEVCQ